MTDHRKINPSALRPGQLVQLLNSTPSGGVATDASTRRHRQVAGYRIGDGKTVDLLRYTAWMAEHWVAKKKSKKTKAKKKQAASGGDSSYEAHRDRAAARQSTISRKGRDIGELPPVENPERREEALRDLKVFCDEYFPKTFYLPWGQPHLQSICDLQRMIEYVENFAEAMPRGYGKSARFERAMLWAGLTGKREFGVILAENEDAAKDEVMGAIKTELETNDLLLADFPEVCVPIHKLEGITQRARGQLYQGVPTYITWEDKKVVLPTIPGSNASGFIIRAGGLLGRTRGLKHLRPDGRVVRPDLVFLDDPQTDDSAANPAQVNKRLKRINGAVLRMAGPDQRIAAGAAVTLIELDDVADQITDRKKNPKWHGRRYKTITKFPRDDKGKFDQQWWALWQEYYGICCKELEADKPPKKSNAFYKKNRAAMDAGVEVAWEHKIEPGFLSAIQSAMFWLLDDPDSFWAEGQNDPQPPELGDTIFDADGLWSKMINIPRGVVPATATTLTAFIDVQKAYLPWMVCAWGEHFTGHIMAYGTWPDQGTSYFKRRGAKKTIARAKPGVSRSEQLYHALSELTSELLGRAWPTEAGAEMSIDLVLIDAGFDTDYVVNFIRELRNPRVMPSRGDGLKPSDTPIPERKPKEGQKLGHHWMTHVPAKRAINHLFIDTNRWKSIVAEGLAAAKGAPGTITIHAWERARHRILLDHLTAEYGETIEARGRKMDIWTCRANRENDLFDDLVGCAAGASLRGITARGHQPLKRSGKRRRASGNWAGGR